MPAPLVARAAVAVAVLAPLGLAMGMPFPLGLRGLAGGRVTGVAWAWGMNGFAAVIAAPASALIGLEAGSAMLMGVAVVAYVVAAGAATPSRASRLSAPSRARG